MSDNTNTAISSITENLPPHKQLVKDLQERKQTEENIIKEKMNIPERDTAKYPDISDEQKAQASLFMYQLSLIGSTVDGNLKSLLWHVYLQMSNFIKCEGRKTDEERQEALINSMKRLRAYTVESNNPCFKTFSQALKESEEPKE